MTRRIWNRCSKPASTHHPVLVCNILLDKFSCQVTILNLDLRLLWGTERIWPPGASPLMWRKPSRGCPSRWEVPVCLRLHHSFMSPHPSLRHWLTLPTGCLELEIPFKRLMNYPFTGNYLPTSERPNIRSQPHVSDKHSLGRSLLAPVSVPGPAWA